MGGIKMATSIEYKYKPDVFPSQYSHVEIVISGSSEERKKDLNKLYEKVPNLKERIIKQVEKQNVLTIEASVPKIKTYMTEDPLYDLAYRGVIKIKNLPTNTLENIVRRDFGSREWRDAADELGKRNVWEKGAHYLANHPEGFTPFKYGK